MGLPCRNRQIRRKPCSAPRQTTVLTVSTQPGSYPVIPLYRYLTPRLVVFVPRSDQVPKHLREVLAESDSGIISSERQRPQALCSMTTEARSPCMPAATITGSPGGRPSTLGSVTDIWRREPESNRRRRICNPLHDHSAIAPINSGFAGRCMTTLPPRRMLETREQRRTSKTGCSFRILERETSLELATLTLARLRSTN